MSKRKNKSRFTKTDVNTICELQRKIDAYESYILCLFHISKKGTKPDTPIVVLRDTDMDEWLGMAVENIWKMKRDLIAFHDKEEMNKMPKMEPHNDKNEL